ncbi:hypothetical protein STASHLEY_00450 [Brevundimonas phage vB_BpoS-StAshley]|nr:hypothetical protein STASHLEY_00450 [Brevundimonas phage vB_BpoS-StAshley]
MTSRRTHSVPAVKGVAADSQVLMRFQYGLNKMVRGIMARLNGGSFGGARDYYKTFGWDESVDSAMMWEKYNRGGIARRIVNAYGDAVWGNAPTFEGATAAWQNAWEDLAEELDIWSVFLRLDRLSQLGQFAVLVVGYDDGVDLRTPLRPGNRKINYLQPYSDRTAKVTKWGTDPTKPNFGLPEEYTISPNQTELDQMGSGLTQSGPSRMSFVVHHSRILHVAQGTLESQVFGAPLLWAVWNYLTDLDKIVGGSAESYWLTANRGMSVNLDKDVDLEPEDEAALTEEIEEYQHGLRRFVRTRGADVKSLGSDVANPEGPFQTVITLIAGTTGMPKRVLLGSEAGHNASTQDKGSWAEKIVEYRDLTAGPQFLIAFIKMATKAGVLPTLTRAKKYKIMWPDAYRLSPLESSQRSNQQATSANNLGLALKNLRNLMTRQEARGLIGLPKDDKGDELEIAAATPGAPDQEAGDGGIEMPGEGSGTVATPTSDSGGKGAPTQATK